MKCVRCGKPLTRPALMTGAYAWGPKCARLAGLSAQAEKLPRRAARIIENNRSTVADPRQMALELAA